MRIMASLFSQELAFPSFQKTTQLDVLSTGEVSFLPSVWAWSGPGPTWAGVVSRHLVFEVERRGMLTCPTGQHHLLSSTSKVPALRALPSSATRLAGLGGRTQVPPSGITPTQGCTRLYLYWKLSSLTSEVPKRPLFPSNFNLLKRQIQRGTFWLIYRMGDLGTHNLREGQ